MDNSDLAEFTAIIQGLYERYKRNEPSAMLVKDWMDDFEDWSINDFKHALSLHRKKSRYMPEPFDLFGIRDAARGVLSPQEAWNIALDSLDEGKTTVISEEILEALSAARHILDAGSPSLAADAFKSAYAKALASRPAGKQKWIVSLGHSIEGRDDVIRDAVERKLISSGQGHKLLSRATPDVFALLENKSSPTNQTHRDKVAALRKIMDESAGCSERDRQAKKAEAQEKLDQFEENRRAAAGSIKQLTGE